MVKTTHLFLPNPKWKAITTALLQPNRTAVKLSLRTSWPVMRARKCFKISATKTIPGPLQPRTNTSVHAISNSSWRRDAPETTTLRGSSAVHFFIIGYPSDFELNTHKSSHQTNKIGRFSPLQNLLRKPPYIDSHSSYAATLFLFVERHSRN